MERNETKTKKKIIIGWQMEICEIKKLRKRKIIVMTAGKNMLMLMEINRIRKKREKKWTK